MTTVTGAEDHSGRSGSLRPSSSEEQSETRVVFQLGGIHLALPSGVIRSVSPPLPLCRVPQYPTSSALLGLVAFAGEIAPCCSLERILMLPDAAASAPTRTIILQERLGELWAFPVIEVLSEACGRERARQEGDPYPEIDPTWSDMILEDQDGRTALLLKPDSLLQAMNKVVR